MENASDDANNLIDYFNSTYVNGHFRTTSRPVTSGEMSSQVKLRRIPPRYPPHLWNMYDATLAGDDRTNNICESWNHGFNSAVGHRHPSLWRLITHLKEDEAQVHLEILQAARGLPPSKRVRKSTKNLHEKLKSLCEKRSTDHMGIPEFLQSIGHCIRF